MDVREKLVEMSEQLRYCADVSDCANCKRWDKVCENQCVDNLLLMAADLIDEVANGVTIQKWIPVSERLPEEWDRVLVCTSANTKNVARLVKGIWRVTWNLEHIEAVTHWMPLPEPPKEE